MRKIGASLLMLVLVLGLAPISSRADEPRAVVKLGYIPVVIYAPLYVGIERGYFAAEGVDVQLIPVPAGAGDSIIQLQAGNFDAAATGAGATYWNAAHQGGAFRIVAPLHTERPPISSPLVISADRAAEIKTVADLKGKKIAVNNKGSAIEYWVYSALKKAGLNMNDVTIVNMPFPQMPQALQNRAIDAAVITDPLATQAKEQGLVSFLADDYIDGVTVTYVFFGERLLKDRPQVAEAFIRAYIKAARDLQGDGWLNKDVAAMIEKYTKVPADLVLRMNRPYFDPNATISVENLKDLQTYFLGRGLLEYTDPLDISSLIDTSLVEKALKALGPYSTPTMAPTAAK